MELPAHCKKLLTGFLVLLVSQIHLNFAQDRSFAQIVPTGLQLFEYGSLSINCLNAETGWTVMRRRKGEVSACVSNWVTTTASVCAIKPVYLTDSGEYWCKKGGETSNTVNITVTAGAVILESPAVPVKEGEVVTLVCRSSSTVSSSAHMADFFKDGQHINSSSTGKMTINRVSESDEGLYKCRISDSGESPQSWLAVRVLHRATQSASESPCHIDLVLRTVFTVVIVVLLLLIVRLLHRGNIRVTWN